MGATLAWILAGVVALWAQRAIRAYRIEARFRAKYAVGDKGIIVGAEPRTYEAPGARALLLIHGYNDSPQSLDQIARRIHAAGWTVRLPLLPGHGRSIRAFSEWTAEEAFDLVREEYAALRAVYPTVVVGGLSMGGGLACWLAAEAEVDGVLLFAPMLFVPKTMEWAVHTTRLWNLAIKYAAGGGGKSIHDPEAFAKFIAYRASSRGSLEALERIARSTVVRLGFVHAPVLIIQSEEDHRLPRDQSAHAHARLGAKDRTIEWTRGAGHVLTVDYGWERIADRAIAWLTARFPAARRSAEIARID